MTHVPADIFIVPEHIEIITDGVVDVNSEAVSIRCLSALQSSGDQASRVGRMRILNQLP